MQTKGKNLDFTGQPIYVGIDVHKNSWKASIYSSHTFQKTFILQRPFVDNLVKYLNTKYPNGEYQCAYEAGFSGFWAQEQLEAKGVNTIVVNPADIPTTDKERQFKNDKRDSKKIALTLRSGELIGIYVPDKQAQKDRSTVRVRSQVAKNQRRVKNQIKSTLHFYGLEIPEDFSQRYWSRKFVVWLEQISKKNKLEGLRLLIEEHLALRKLELKAIRVLRKLSKQKRHSELTKLLNSVPGVGLLTLMLLITEIIDMKRFKREDELYAYVGLIPTSASSGDKETIGEMTKRGNKRLKSAAIESAWVAIKKDPQLLMKYEEYRKRMGGHKAIVKIARILMRRIRRVWLKKEPYLITEY